MSIGLIEKLRLGYQTEKQYVLDGLAGKLEVFAYENVPLVEAGLVSKDDFPNTTHLPYIVGALVFNVLHIRKTNQFDRLFLIYSQHIRESGLESARKILHDKGYVIEL